MEFTHTEFHLIDTWEYTTDKTHIYHKYIGSLLDLKEILSGVETTINGDQMTIKNITPKPIEFAEGFARYCKLRRLLLPQQEQTITLGKPEISLVHCGDENWTQGMFCDIGSSLFPDSLGFEMYNMKYKKYIKMI